MAQKLDTSRRKLLKLLKQHQKTIKQAAPTKHWWPAWARLRWDISLAIVIGVVISLFLTLFSVQPVSVVGVQVGNRQSVASLESAIKQRTDGYKLAIQYPDGSQKSFSLDEMGISINTSATAQRAMDTKMADNFLRRIQWWHKLQVEPVLTYDQTKFGGFVQANATQVATPAKDATIGVDRGNVIVTPEQEGTGNSLSEPKAAITSAISSVNTQPLVLAPNKLTPAITQTDLGPVSDKVKTILAQPVTFTINGQKVTAKPADIGGWLELTPVPSNKTVDVTINSGRVLNYMNAIAKPYIQPPTTQVVMPSAGTVLIPGRNGVDIVNKEAMAADVARQISANQSVSVDLPVKFSAFKTINAEPHDKWLVVDTTTKRMYAYEQNRLVKSFLISAGAPATPTVTGEFKIYSKYASQDMRGANADGSRYFQPNVQYVNYFYADYAIHGNYWRPTSYFGNINSSHGCVGIVNTDAAWIYAWAPIGTTVIVHR